MNSKDHKLMRDFAVEVVRRAIVKRKLAGGCIEDASDFGGSLDINGERGTRIINGYVWHCERCFNNGTGETLESIEHQGDCIVAKAFTFLFGGT